MNRILLILFITTMTSSSWSQNYTLQTFKDTRVINTHSVETLPKRKLDVRIGHRFGDFGGEGVGFKTLFGLENASDVLIGAEYGATDNLTIGLFRSKGAGAYPNGSPGLRQLLNGVFKYRFVRQGEEGGTPFTLTFVGVSSLSTAQKVEGNPDIIRSFPKFEHRMANTAQLLIARKFSDGFSLQIIPSYTYRNLVAFDDQNGLFSLGMATRLQISKVLGIIADATVPIQDYRDGNGFYPAIGFGFEFDTGGHIFQVNFTNATAVMETDYIPYTTSNWAEGEFRLGFTISRLFNL